MSAVDLCEPRYWDDGTLIVCARAVSQRAATRRACGYPPGKVSGEGEGFMLCRDCIDDLSLLAGNVRAVQQEWEVA